MFKKAFSAVKQIHSSIESRIELLDHRTDFLRSSQKSLVKVAFDTRRTNQEVDFNPRRNLQYYHRSEPFITKEASAQLKTLFKLKTAVDTIKEDFIGDPDWLDSYARVLSASLDRTLRTEQKDMDFFKPQLDYLNELLYLRYRIKADDIERFSEKQLREIVLEKDDKLQHKFIYAQYNTDKIVKTNSMEKTEDTLINKLFGEVKASQENKNVERTVSITINDKIKDEDKDDIKK